jgi:hypothetical protein
MRERTNDECRNEEGSRPDHGRSGQRNPKKTRAIAECGHAREAPSPHDAANWHSTESATIEGIVRKYY